jgi:hypothetical protein
MNLVRIALLSAAGLVTTTATAASASAGELGLGVTFGDHGTRGFVGARFGPAHRGPIVHAGGHVPFGRPFHPAPPVYVAPYRPPFVQDPECREVWIPARTVWREEVVFEAAVYDTRRVPVFDTRAVPAFAQRYDARIGRVVRVQVGERRETVQVGERLERVLVRPETRRVVRVPETIPGRMVLVCRDHGHDHDGDRDGRRHRRRDGDRGRDHLRDRDGGGHRRDLEVLTEAEYRALLQPA